MSGYPGINGTISYFRVGEDQPDAISRMLNAPVFDEGRYVTTNNLVSEFEVLCKKPDRGTAALGCDTV